ncbi:hypothetical protein LXA43DRAFT_171719 [Ganoderma leucocontextum]|nr:hypothetical protein LXA43DRAFT_171719 [Ganoderma leucocontextum]
MDHIRRDSLTFAMIDGQFAAGRSPCPCWWYLPTDPRSSVRVRTHGPRARTARTFATYYAHLQSTDSSTPAPYPILAQPLDVPPPPTTRVTGSTGLSQLRSRPPLQVKRDATPTVTPTFKSDTCTERRPQRDRAHSQGRLLPDSDRMPLYARINLLEKHARQAELVARGGLPSRYACGRGTSSSDQFQDAWTTVRGRRKERSGWLMVHARRWRQRPLDGDKMLPLCLRR